jgi:hypothetical protein
MGEWYYTMREIQWNLFKPTFFQLTEILWDLNFLSDVTGCQKTQLSGCTSLKVGNHCKCNMYTNKTWVFRHPVKSDTFPWFIGVSDKTGSTVYLFYLMGIDLSTDLIQYYSMSDVTGCQKTQLSGCTSLKVGNHCKCNMYTLNTGLFQT